MRRAILLGLLAMISSCGRELTLPSAPVPNGLPPVVELIEPTIAIASFGSRVQLSGANLAGAEELRVGPFSLKAGDFAAEGTAGQMLSFHVAEENGFDPVQLQSVDGQSLPVRVVKGGVEYAVSRPLRVFSGVSTVEEIAPRSLAPGQLVYIRGKGFDALVLENNEIYLNGDELCDAGIGSEDSGSGGGEVGGSAGSGGRGDGLEPPPLPGGPGCSRASVFWATDNLVLAVVPDEVPGGAVKVSYKNRAFAELDAFAEEFMAAGDKTASDMYSEPEAFGDPVAGGAGGSGGLEDDSPRAAMPGELAGGLSDEVYVWRDPGLITVETLPADLVPGGTAVISSADRLAYPDPSTGGLHPQLMVLVDGVPLAGLAQLLSAEGSGFREDALELTLPLDLLSGPHSLQVVNPFFESPVAWLRVP